MGVVVAATHEQLDQKVALKFLLRSRPRALGSRSGPSHCQVPPGSGSAMNPRAQSSSTGVPPWWGWDGYGEIGHGQAVQANTPIAVQ